MSCQNASGPIFDLGPYNTGRTKRYSPTYPASKNVATTKAIFEVRLWLLSESLFDIALNQLLDDRSSILRVIIFRPRSPIAEAAISNFVQCGCKSRRGHHHFTNSSFHGREATSQVVALVC